MEKIKIWFSWSTGKDCAYALHQLRADEKYEINGLLTTINSATRSVAMHDIPEVLLKRQAAELGITLYCAEAGGNHSQSNFELQMKNLLKIASEQNISHIAFGDLFLEDIRSYREQKMQGTGLGLLFPLWKQPTVQLAKNIVSSGFKAIIVSVDLNKLPISLLGRAYDEELLKELPDGTDPCGENGEFHTFVWDGPHFKNPIPVKPGEVKVTGQHAHIQLIMDP